MIMNTDDVKLISRKHEQVYSFLSEEEEKLKQQKSKNVLIARAYFGQR